MEVSFDIQEQEECRRAYERDLQITDVHLCAGTLDGSKDSCQVIRGFFYYVHGYVIADACLEISTGSSEDQLQCLYSQNAAHPCLMPLRRYLYSQKAAPCPRA
ncbi:hypothetical protein AVEN_70347-1 [Araneus ventricosus]|uniref:Peptidase S1 domain-containing protein n=1 Tax=Araneus ventricosus TaxID=182803 RepID=A0A4Y2QQH5_ARAVE|nr:hypothetical protein AVEN_70347-1 [Araneus ventricosus]